MKWIGLTFVSLPKYFIYIYKVLAKVKLKIDPIIIYEASISNKNLHQSYVIEVRNQVLNEI
jgi:hypothetical protein